MNPEQIKEFFAYRGEIWANIANIEFLMRCAIAKKDNEIDKFPLPPYSQWKAFLNSPQSFKLKYFSKVVKEFNLRFPNYSSPVELVEFRNGFAHGFIAAIGNDPIQQLVKFNKGVWEEIIVDYHLSLELEKIVQLRDTVRDYRIKIMPLAQD